MTSTGSNQRAPPYAAGEPASVLWVHPRMNAFAPYVDSLERLAREALDHGSLGLDAELVAAVLDGQPGARLRDLIPLPVRRATGAFFTGATLAERVIAPYARTLSATSTVFDPACGVGDLLVACARHLPLGPDLAATIATWGGQLRGIDIHPEFVRAAKARLVLLARSRGVPIGTTLLPPLDEAFPQLIVGDGLANRAFGNTASHIVLNPPYPRVPAPPDYQWGSGKVSLAAIFLERCLAEALPGARIIAILPDVLRTGSLYAKWRAAVQARAVVESVQVFGTFDAWADIDVFILRLTVTASPSGRATMWWEPPAPAAGGRVGDHFNVHVGPVVPHRHPKLGCWYPYVYARLLPGWGVLDIEKGPRRRFRGRTFAPPFVAVRRTSAPTDRQRAVGTLVTGDRPVAVENHLLVLAPRDGSLDRCKELLAVLRDDRTRLWLDQRIRCRHLTVAALQDLPWWGDRDAD